MNSKIFGIFIIITLIFVIPSASAQEFNIGDKAKQKSVEVTINESGEMHVKHIIRPSNSPVEVKLMDGKIENLIITDEKKNEKMLTVIGENDGVLILPTDNDSIIEYDLIDVIMLKDNVWTLDFLYLGSTKFFLPNNVDLFFVNDRPVSLGNKEGFACHGCQMILEYSIGEPKKSYQIDWEDRKFFVEIKSHAEIDAFEFSQPEKRISFVVNDENRFVTTIIPLELLWEPYTDFLDDEKIFFSSYINNGTHVWLNMRPDTVGEILIIGTTVVPEFSIIAPLAIGFLMVILLPFLRKVNLH